MAVIDTERKKLYIHRFTSHIGSKKGFAESTQASVALFNQVKDYFVSYGISPDVIAFESASPLGMVSCSMWLLDAILTDRIYEEFSVDESFVFHTSYLTWLHHKRYKKSDSVQLSKQIMQRFLDSGYTQEVIVKTRCHDEYEAIIFATRLFLRYNSDISFMDICERLHTEKEVLVYRRMGTVGG